MEVTQCAGSGTTTEAVLYTAGAAGEPPHPMNNGKYAAMRSRRKDRPITNRWVAIISDESATGT
jgi:hypothetical protein